MKNPRRITAGEAARVMGVDALFLRTMMQQGRLPIGEADVREGCSRWNYLISPKLLADYMGMTMEELWKEINDVRKQKERTA